MSKTLKGAIEIGLTDKFALRQKDILTGCVYMCVRDFISQKFQEVILQNENGKIEQILESLWTAITGEEGI